MKRLSRLLLLTIFCFTVAIPGYGQQRDLSEFAWKNRVLLGHPKTLDELNMLSAQLAERSEELSERRIQVILNWRNRLRYIPESKVKVSHSEVIRLLAEQQGNYLLIGLDGATKHRYVPDSFDLEMVFGHIDLMPMRQAELNAAPEEARRN